jgi:DNA-binding response OmpR family regulator
MVRRVLLVEDDAAIRDMYQLALKTAGFEVTVVGDGEEAVAEVRRSVPNVVVLDVHMPKLDGIGVLGWIRNTARLSVPVIVLSNSAGIEHRLTAEGLGIAAWLVKSQTLPGQLAEVLTELPLAS